MSEVGYRRPPKATRWKKGQSGNPRGRQKGVRNLRTELAAELAETVVVKEGGSPRKITKQRALVKSLAARAIQGDSRAAGLLVQMMLRLLETNLPGTSETSLSPEDSAIVAAFLQQHRPDPEDVT